MLITASGFPEPPSVTMSVASTPSFPNIPTLAVFDLAVNKVFLIELLYKNKSSLSF